MTYSFSYSQLKKDEFYKQLAQTLTNLESKQVQNTVYNLIIENFINYIRNLDELEFKRMSILPKTLLMKKMDKFFKRLNYILMFKFRKLLTSLWAETYQLGINHQVQDMLYVTNLFSTFDKQNKKAKFSSLLGDSLINHVLPDTTNLAEFAAGDDEETISNIKAIGRARRNLTLLQKNVNKLQIEENLFSPTKLQGSEAKASRLTIKQRIEFLRAVQEISDFSKKAEASKKTFLGDNYLQQRIRVLGADYAAGYDNYIKEQLASYVNENIEGVRQIRKNKARTTALRQQITNQILAQKGEIKSVDPVIKARNILRTELSIAYNFGKLAGFTSTLDETRKVRWNSDWELENSRNRITKKVTSPSGYEVCKACAAMDGRVFTVRELLIIGTRLDKGILRHDGSKERSTDFKNPSLPMIPFHPNCACYWTVEPLDTEEEVLEEAAALPTMPQQAYESGQLPGAMQEVRRVSDNSLPVLLGTGLLVGGLFLMARSNVWKSFFRTVRTVESATPPPKVIETATDIVSDVARVGRTIKIEIKNPQLFEEFEDVVINTVRTGSGIR